MCSLLFIVNVVIDVFVVVAIGVVAVVTTGAVVAVVVFADVVAARDFCVFVAPCVVATAVVDCHLCHLHRHGCRYRHGCVNLMSCLSRLHPDGLISPSRERKARRQHAPTSYSYQ